MSEMTDLPEWVWDLLDALSAYEDEHPILYRMTDADVYGRWPCFGGYLSERKAWPPRDVQGAAEFRRAVRARLADELDPARNLPPCEPSTAPLTPDQPPADHGSADV